MNYSAVQSVHVKLRCEDSAVLFEADYTNLADAKRDINGALTEQIAMSGQGAGSSEKNAE
jgi:hypothetical protein